MVEETQRTQRSPGFIGAAALGLFLIGTGPMLVSTAAGWIANSQKCVLSAGGQGLCQIFGIDAGAVLYTLFTLGWLSRITIWLIPVAVVVAVVAAIGWWRGRGQDQGRSRGRDQERA